MSLQDSTQIENVKVLLKVGADGRGIAEIVKVGTSGVVDTYDIVLSDGTRIPFDVTNGSSIDSIEKTATVGLVDTYTITLTNGDTFEFEVTNADGSTAETVDYDNTSSGLDATNVQDAIDEVNDKCENKADKTDITSISQSGATATQAIPSGTYFYLDGVLVRAKTAIASGATFTENTNYEVVTVGGLNSVSDNIVYVVDSTSYILPSVGSAVDVSKPVALSGYKLVAITNVSSNSSSVGIGGFLPINNNTAFMSFVNINNTSQVGQTRTATWTNIFIRQ